MPFNVKKRGKLTYYFEGDRPVLSSLVTEELPDGDLKISFAGLTGGYSAKSILGLDELVTMDPRARNPAGLRLLGEVAAGRGHLRVAARRRLHRDPRLRLPAEEPAPAGRSGRLRRGAGAAAPAPTPRPTPATSPTHLPDNGVPARFTVHVVDVPDTAASYEFYGTALLQRSLQNANTRGD